MSDKISGVNGGRPASVGVRRTSVRPQDPTSPASQQSSGSETESVQITGAASQLASLEQTVKSLPVVDEARVSALRSAIDQGTYQISPGKIADNLMQFEHALGALGTEGK